MKKVNTAELEAGMKIAQKVENANGMVLLPEGIVLTEAHIGRLKKWGIESIFVEGEGEDGGGGGVVPSMELSEEFIKNLDHKFSINVNNFVRLLSPYLKNKSCHNVWIVS